MCSIIGYLGSRTAATFLVDGLQRMEYRGYDSAGLATLYYDKIVVRKGVGKVAEVDAVMDLRTLAGTVGVGHTRWATHGGVTQANAHPHLSSTGRLAIVHNGIVDNYRELKERLIALGYDFKSETDSEAIANLLQYHYDLSRNIRESMLRTSAELKGSYAFVALFDNGTLAAARYHEPLILGLSRDGYFVASDILGFVQHTDKVIYVDNRDVAVVGEDGIQICDFDGNPVQRQIIKISNEMACSEKGDYAHHTLKEIFEQPLTIPRAAGRSGPEFEKAVELIRSAKRVYATGSGTSFHATLMAKYLFAKHANVSVEPIISSEARFAPNQLDSDSVLIALSQSGETADVLEAVGVAQEKGAKVIAIVNVPTSSLAHTAAVSIGLGCGPEIGVAATKSFTSQLATIYKLTDQLSGSGILQDLGELSKHVAEVLQHSEEIRDLAHKMRNVRDIYLLGTGIHYPIAAEASLKLKELSYIHAEALPGGELKHGPLALLDSNAHVVVMNPKDSTYTNVLASAHEVKARNAKIIGVSDRPNPMYDYWIEIPSMPEPLFPIIEVIPLQILSYYLALERNADPDYPRNLAKSVTVR